MRRRIRAHFLFVLALASPALANTSADVVAAVAGPNATLSLLDRPFEALFSSPGTWFGRNGTFVRLLGTDIPIALPAGFYLAGALNHDTTAKKAGVAGYEALAGEAVVVVALKGLTGQSRPYTGKGPLDFHLFGGNSGDKASFPSGDTATAFAVATVAGEAWPSWWVRATGFGLAGAAAAGRMVQDEHYFSDVAAGAAIGWLCGKAAWDLETRRAWLKSLYTDGRGVYLSRRF